MKSSDRLFNIVWRQTLFAMSMMILSNIGAILVDGIIAGKVFGANASAALGLISPYTMLTALIGGLLGTGCQTFCSKALGSGDLEASNKTFVSSFYFGFISSLILSVLMFVFARPISMLIGASGDSEELLGETASYLRGISVGTAGMVLNVILAPVVQLYGGRRQVNLSVLLIFVSDVLFDLTAVVLDMGCLGIGLATSFSTYLGTVIMLIYIVSGKTSVDLSPRHFDFTVLRPVLKQGMPDAVKRFLRMSGDVFSNYFVLLTAAGAAMAGKTTGALLASLLSVLGMGAASSMYMLSGVFTASEDEESLYSLGKRQIRVLLITLALTLISIVFSPQITVLMLKADTEASAAAIPCVRCILIQIPIYICFEMVTYYMQSIGRGKSANIMSLLGSTVLYIPLIVLMGRKFGAVGVLLSAPAALSLTLAAFYIILCIRLHRLASLRDIMHISECINVDGIDVITHSSVESLEETIECSESIRLALIKKGSGQKTAYAAALFVEELCSNVLIYGAAKNALFSKAKSFASVFAYIENSFITLRISDNCSLFDPQEKFKNLEADKSSPETGLGLRLVFSAADEASYTGMLNINNLIIRVPLSGGKFAAGSSLGKLRIERTDVPVLISRK